MNKRHTTMITFLISGFILAVILIPMISSTQKHSDTIDAIKKDYQRENVETNRLITTIIESTQDKDMFGPFIVNHTSVTTFHQIPEYWIQQAKNDLHIAYQHTSHGSQLVTGMNALEQFPIYEDTYAWSDDGSYGLDLDDYGIPGCADLSQGDWIDEYGVTPWVTATRNLLNNPSNSHVNVIMWSWCSINGHNITRYLENMEILITEYPEVTFIFMTGHAEGQGEGGYIHTVNEQIRQHCINNNRILFDFADIENYDPDNVYYYDKPMWDDLDYNPGRTHNWGEEWIDNNIGSELEQLTTGNGVDEYNGCQSCAHSDGPGNKARINCILKGRGVWWMMAKLAGWNQSILPTASFSYVPIYPLVSVPVEFTDTSTDSDGSIVNWSWIFGDGESSYEQHPTHQYIDPDNYMVNLQVTDNDGYVDDFCQQLTVTNLTGDLDVNQSSFDRGFPIRHAIDGDWAAAQSFIPTLDTLTSVDIHIRKFGTPEFNLTLEVREDSPDGTVIESFEYHPELFDGNWHWLNLDIEDIENTSGTDYFIVCPPAPSGVTTSFGYEWGYAFGNQYDDGAFWFTRDGGALWRDLPTMYEFVFRTYGYS